MSTFKSTPAQWGYFRKLTGHSLPSGCSKSKASSLIKQALAGTWKPPVRHIEVGRYRIIDCFDVTSGHRKEPGWEVRVDYRSVHSGFATQGDAIAAAQREARDGETVTFNASVREVLVD